MLSIGLPVERPWKLIPQSSHELLTQRRTVTGQASSQPNANGWYNDDVTVDWTATDPDPSSRIAAQPNSTIVKGEGNALAAESAQVCDNAGNCSTGKVDGIKIDRTKPTIEVLGVTDGETYTLGAVPVASCSQPHDAYATSRVFLPLWRGCGNGPVLRAVHRCVAAQGQPTELAWTGETTK